MQDLLDLNCSDSEMNKSNNLNLRDYLSNKRKLHLEELVDISPSQCEQAGFQLKIVHSVHCCLGLFTITHFHCASSCHHDRQFLTDYSVKTSKRSRSLIFPQPLSTWQAVGMIHGDLEDRDRVLFLPFLHHQIRTIVSA